VRVRIFTYSTRVRVFLYAHLQQEYECSCTHLQRLKKIYKLSGGTRGERVEVFVRKYRMSLRRYGPIKYLLKILPPILAGQSPNKKIEYSGWKATYPVLNPWPASEPSPKRFPFLKETTPFALPALLLLFCPFTLPLKPPRQ